MRQLFCLAALTACCALPATAQQIVRQPTQAFSPPGSAAAALEAQLSPQTAPIGTLKVGEQSPVMTLEDCRAAMRQRLQAQNIPYDADNVTQNPAARDAPLKATVMVGERVAIYACEWAQPCLPRPMPGLTLQVPACDTNKIVLKVYQEG